MIVRFDSLVIPTKYQIAETDSANAKWLTQAGYIDQVSAGVYQYLPLGLRVLNNIQQVVRQEMKAVGASEALFPSLQPKSLWQTTGRWTSMSGILYRESEETQLFAPTHEEVVTDWAKSLIKSYRDLPLRVFQIQTKFRREPRAKSGLLRGREFIMKDLYSFHADQSDLDDYYEQVAQAYERVFARFELPVVRTKASGGDFSQEFSDEYQAICPRGEDEIYYQPKKMTGYNQEIIDQVDEAEKKQLKAAKAIEVGNIFKLGTKFSRAFEVSFLDDDGERRTPVMGCYGLGISRLMGALAEIFHDEQGLVWPVAAAPFKVHLVCLVDELPGSLVQLLEALPYEVLVDEREESAGAMLKDADLIGCPIRLVYSQKTATEGKIELKKRTEANKQLVATEDLASRLTKILDEA